MIGLVKWAPAVILSVGAALIHGVAPQKSVPLQASLESVVPREIEGYEGVDQEVSEAEAEVAGFDDYLLRTYAPEETLAGEEPAEEWMSLYVGYYESQTQGSTIHSPKNCLPGAGWEPIRSGVAQVTRPDGSVEDVNRYILQREDEQALVLYWYQGRGRVAHNEYLVKFDLLRDAALKRRSDEALVRIVVPVTSTEDVALQKAQSFARTLIPALNGALPL